MSSRKRRWILRNWHIEQLKPKVVYQYGKEMQEAFIQQEIESAPEEMRSLVARFAHQTWYGHAHQFLMQWYYGYDQDLRFHIPSGKVRVRNMVIYWER